MTSRRVRAAIRHAEIRARYGRGETHAQIARAMGISVALSSHVCRAAGLSRAQGVEPRIDPKDAWRSRQAKRRADVLKLRARGLLHREIAERLGVSMTFVGTVLREAGDRRRVGTLGRPNRQRKAGT